MSTVAGGNVVTMGEALERKMMEIIEDVPLGIQFGIISLQSVSVIQAIDSFVVSLMQAVAIVIVVLLFFMGLRSGVLIGFILTLTIAATFILMALQGVMLERTSLGALIIALGMLVDNAIVVVDGMLVRMARGQSGEKAATKVVGQSAVPLLGATAIAILAFAAIGTSQDNTGEYARSLFYVILFSLSLSWVTAVTVTPVLGAMFLPKPPEGAETPTTDDPDAGLLGTYRRLLAACLRWRWATVAIVVALFVTAVGTFGMVPSGLFPASTRPQLMVDVWLPEGTRIEETAAVAEQMRQAIAMEEDVTHVTTVTGSGGLRFLLTFGPESPNPAYALLLVDTVDASRNEAMYHRLNAMLPDRFPEAQVNVKPFLLGPNNGGKIQARLYGEDPDALRTWAEQVSGVLEDDGAARAVWHDWRQRTRRIVPVLDEDAAAAAGMTSPVPSAPASRASPSGSIGKARTCFPSCSGAATGTASTRPPSATCRCSALPPDG